jgi:hypothetical protein
MSGSALYDELSVPLPRPVDGQPGVISRVQSPYDIPTDAKRYVPFGIRYNPNFVPLLLRDFRRYCIAHPNRGNDRRHLATIEMARRDAGNTTVYNEADTTDLLTGTIFYPVTRSLHCLEDTRSLRRRSEFNIAYTSTRADVIWLDHDESLPPRVNTQLKSLRVANGFFPHMVQMSRLNHRFDNTASSFSGAECIVVKVSFDLSVGLPLASTQPRRFQGSVEAAHLGADYVIYHSGFGMIVHHFVPHGDRYYIEASQMFEIDSGEHPHMALFAAILFAARPQALPPTQEPPDVRLETRRLPNRNQLSSTVNSHRRAPAPATASNSGGRGGRHGNPSGNRYPDSGWGWTWRFVSSRLKFTPATFLSDFYLLS